MQFGKSEIHTVFLDSPNFLRKQNLSLSALADLIRASLVYGYIALVEERIALGHFLQGAHFLQKPMLQFDSRRSADLSQKAQVQRKAEYS